MEGRDACDKAKANGLADDVIEFHNCSPRKKLACNPNNQALKARLAMV